MRRSPANVSERRQSPPSVAVSTVAFALHAAPAVLDHVPTSTQKRSKNRSQKKPASTAGALWLPLVRRLQNPFEGRWALPGDTLAWDESPDQSARRTTMLATGVLPRYLEQLYTFGAPERSANLQRLVTIAYWALLSEDEWPNVKDVANVQWFSADELPELAFDHADIVAMALARLRSKAEYSLVAHRFLGSSFTLAQLRAVHEAILGTQADPANFRRHVLATGTLQETGQTSTGSRHRPAKLYRFGDLQPTPTGTGTRTSASQASK